MSPDLSKWCLGHYLSSFGKYLLSDIYPEKYYYFMLQGREEARSSTLHSATLYYLCCYARVDTLCA